MNFKNITGGPNGGKHVTDVTNASRTLLMNIATLNWEPVSDIFSFILKFNNWELIYIKYIIQVLLRAFGIDKSILPKIISSSEIVGTVNDGSPLQGIKISAVSSIVT